MHHDGIALSIAAVLVFVTLGTSPASLMTQDQAWSLRAIDSEGVLRQFVEAVNAGNPDAVVALFTSEATWERGGRCPAGTCAGHAAIRREVEMDVRDGHRIDVLSLETKGDQSTARLELRTAATRARGVERLIRLLTITVRDDKITALRFEDDLSDAVTAAFVAGQRPVMTPPTTGDAGLVR